MFYHIYQSPAVPIVNVTFENWNSKSHCVIFPCVFLLALWTVCSTALACFPVPVTSSTTKNKLMRKISIYILQVITKEDTRTEVKGDWWQKLKPRLFRKTSYSLVPKLLFSHFSYVAQSYLLKDPTTNNGQGLQASISNLENSPQTFPQDCLMGTLLLMSFSHTRYFRLTKKINPSNTHLLLLTSGMLLLLLSYTEKKPSSISWNFHLATNFISKSREVLVDPYGIWCVYRVILIFCSYISSVVI